MAWVQIANQNTLPQVLGFAWCVHHSSTRCSPLVYHSHICEAGIVDALAYGHPKQS